tara:strand:+ start:230 stop:673 length:444 start_codon:yes stop_codon:yes gene_type:complete
MTVNYTDEDLQNHDAVAAVIQDAKGNILMQEHVKYGFWTIPIGKAASGQTPIEAMKEEVLEECDIIVQEFEEVAQKKYEYDRNGKQVKLLLHIYKVIKYSGKISNKEPHKHSKQEFKSVEQIKNIPHLGDATLLYLETLGIKRPTHL